MMLLTDCGGCSGSSLDLCQEEIVHHHNSPMLNKASEMDGRCRYFYVQQRTITLKCCFPLVLV